MSTFFHSEPKAKTEDDFFQEFMEYIDSDNDGFLSFKEYKGKPFSFKFLFHVRSDLTYKFTERVYKYF